MTRTAELILRDALSLDERDRAALAGLLIESLEAGSEDGSEKAWLAEVDHRIQQLDSGEVTTVPWEEVRAGLFKKLRGTSEG